MKNKKTKFFKYAFASSFSGKFGESLAVSLNTLLVALGATAFQIGVVNALHTLGKTLSQLLGLWYINLFSSRRASEIVSMIIISIPKLLLIYVAFTQNKYWFLIVAAVMFFKGLGGQASYLCWFTWMSAIVPKGYRTYFFGTRSFFGQIGKILGFIVAFFVLKLDYPILNIMGSLYAGAFVFYSIGETSMYFLHPDAKRSHIIKNHIIHRMRDTFRDKIFVNFLFWFTILNAILLANTVYLEYYIINDLKLSYLWIPLSFIILALSSATAYYTLRNYFHNIAYNKKRLIISSLVLVSSLLWYFTESLPMIVVSLFFAGFSLGGLTLSEKVDLIKNSAQKDEEAHYAVFRFVPSIFSSGLLFILSFIQSFGYNFKYVFLITIPLALFAYIFISLNTSQENEKK